MNIIRIGRNVTIIAFLLSLLFHGSTILYIFLQKTHKSLINQIDQNQHNVAQPLQQLPTNQQKPWVTTQARAGNFGSPVFFEDLPEEESADDTSATLSTPSTEEELITQEDVHDFSHEQEVEKEEAPEQQEQIIKEMPARHTENNAENNNVFMNSSVQSQQQSRATTKKRAPRKKRAPTATKINTPKPPITLAQLTQGFLDRKSNSSGSHGVSMIGMKTGLPSHEQLKYERYLQKLEWCFQNSFNINRDRMPPVSRNATVYIALAINRDGTLKNLAISQPSGNILLDKFVLFLFQDASSSFPPIPSYLPDNPFAITCIVPISGPY